MPQRPAVIGLPEEIKQDLDKRLVRDGFCNYQALSDWLAEKGYQISRSSLQRYGQQFEEKLAALKIATEQARAITDVIGDEEGAMNEALIRLVQQRAFDVLVKLQEDDETGLLPKIGVMVAKLSKAAVDQKKWQREVKEKAEQAVKNIEKKATGKRSLDPETMKIIKEEIYGII